MGSGGDWCSTMWITDDGVLHTAALPDPADAMTASFRNSLDSLFLYTEGIILEIVNEDRDALIEEFSENPPPDAHGPRSAGVARPVPRWRVLIGGRPDGIPPQFRPIVATRRLPGSWRLHNEGFRAASARRLAAIPPHQTNDALARKRQGKVLNCLCGRESSVSRLGTAGGVRKSPSRGGG